MTDNKAGFSIYDLLLLFDKDSLHNIPDNFASIGVSTDTRTIVQNNIFIALTGENSDGHSRVSEAFAKGASAAIVSSEWYQTNQTDLSSKAIISSGDTLKSLHLLANHHRRRFDLPILAIGGANGKTTTKNMTTHLLQSKYNVLSTFENFNNQIGVPMMLLSLNGEHDIAVLEIGTNEPGEIAVLSDMIEPTFGLITNIGKEHLEKLIDLDGVEMEETYLFGYLHKKGGTCMINFDDERLKRYDRILENKFSFSSGGDETDLQASITLDGQMYPLIKLSYQENSVEFRLRTQGLTTAYNALAASAAALNMGMELNEIAAQLIVYENKELHGYGRMVVENIDGVMLINDCYNANPDSMKAALGTLRNLKTEKAKIAVLGDMRELGDASGSEHLELLKIAADSADTVMIYGNEMLKAFTQIKPESDFHWSDDKTVIAEMLLSDWSNYSAVLVKGSRGMRMEEIINYIKNNR